MNLSTEQIIVIAIGVVVGIILIAAATPIGTIVVSGITTLVENLMAKAQVI